jgi:WD40 repeat protein
VRVFNIDTLTEIGMIGYDDDGSAVIAVAYSADGQRIHAANDVGNLRAWDVKTGQNLMTRRHLLPWRKGAFSPDGKLLLTGGPDGNVGLYDIENHGNQLRRFKAHQGIIHGLAFSPDGSRFATASGAEVTLWTTATATRVSTLRLPQQSVNGAIAILHTNQHILFGGNGLSLALMPPPEEPGAPTSRPAPTP